MVTRRPTSTVPRGRRSGTTPTTRTTSTPPTSTPVRISLEFGQHLLHIPINLLPPLESFGIDPDRMVPGCVLEDVP